MTLSKICTYTSSVANQAIHPFGINKLVPKFLGGNNVLRSVMGGEVGG